MLFRVIRTLRVITLGLPSAIWAIDDDNPGNIFNLPGPAGPGDNYLGDVIWPVGSVQTIDFYTTLDSWYMTLCQNAIDDSGLVGFVQNISCEYSLLSIQSALTAAANTQVGHNQFTWTVDNYNTDLQSSPVFFFWVNYWDSDDSFTSHYFNITDGTVSSSASSSTSSTATSTLSSSTSTPSPTSAGVPTQSAALQAGTATNESNARNLPVGLGIGLGLGIPAAAAVVAFFLWRRRKSAKTGHSSSGTKGPSGETFVQEGHRPPWAHQVYQGPAYPQPRFEAPAKRELTELASSHAEPAPVELWGEGNARGEMHG